MHRPRWPEWWGWGIQSILSPSSFASQIRFEHIFPTSALDEFDPNKEISCAHYRNPTLSLKLQVDLEIEAAGVTTSTWDCKLKANRNAQLPRMHAPRSLRARSLGLVVWDEIPPCRAAYSILPVSLPVPLSPSHLHFPEARAGGRGIWRRERARMQTRKD